MHLDFNKITAKKLLEKIKIRESLQKKLTLEGNEESISDDTLLAGNYFFFSKCNTNSKYQ